jgi:hypothetical protein
MSTKQRIFIPTYISSVDYQPARVQPRILFYNGLKPCEPYFVASGSQTLGSNDALEAFPYFDNYSGANTTTASLSLLFFNEEAVYGDTPTASLYTQYWEDYVELLYNPRTRVLNASAIIPLAEYFKMELNDIVEFRGNYYHLRAINDYNLKNGECDIQLLGPIIGQSVGSGQVTPSTTTTTIAPCQFNELVVDCSGTTTSTSTSTTTTTTAAPTTSTTTAAPTTSTTTAATTTTTAPIGLCDCALYTINNTTFPGSGLAFNYLECGTGTYTDGAVTFQNPVTVCAVRGTFGSAFPFSGPGASCTNPVECTTTTTTTEAPTTTTTTTTMSPGCETYRIFGGSITGATILVNYTDCAGNLQNIRVNRNQTAIICVQNGTTPSKISGTGNGTITYIGDACL